MAATAAVFFLGSDLEQRHSDHQSIFGGRVHTHLRSRFWRPAHPYPSSLQAAIHLVAVILPSVTVKSAVTLLAEFAKHPDHQLTFLTHSCD